jgi:hypothetical protein
VTDRKKRDESSRVPDVSRKTLIIEVLLTREGAGKVLREGFGLPCDECVVAETETIEEGAIYYGHDADEIVRKLNALPTAQSGNESSFHHGTPGEPNPPNPTAT